MRSTSWKPGQSGNPKGGTKKLPEVRELLAARLPAGVAWLADVADGTVVAELRDRLAAVKMLLEWGLPKPSPDKDTHAAARALQAFADALAGDGDEPVPDDGEEDER